MKTMGRKPSEIIVNLKSPTRLENEMRYALQSAAHRGLSYEEAATEVAKKYIEKAMKDSLAHGYQMFGMETKSYQSTYIEPFRSQWLKDNGITE